MDELTKYMDQWFKGSLRMPLAVACDRLNVLDWVDYEAEEILAAGLAADRKAAERQATANLLQSPQLLRALVPELHRARPGPIRLKFVLAALLEAAGCGCFVLVLLEVAALFSGLAFAALAAASRFVLCGVAKTVLALRGQHREIWIAFTGILGCTGYLIYYLAAYLPERRRQQSAAAAA